MESDPLAIRFIITSESFEKDTKHIKDKGLLNKLRKQIQKITEVPEAGKPLRYTFKGERTIYVKPFRLIYSWKGENLILLRLVHRDEAYKI